MHLVAGARLRVLPPAGRFVLEPPATGTLMLVAAGVGITPLRAMLHALVAQDAPMRTLLLHAARQHDGLCYAAEFERLAREYPWFEYLPILSCPTPAWRGLRGRLNAERVLQYASVADTTLYLCAPRTMIEQLSDGLIGAGVAPQRIQYEHFGVAGAGTGVHRVSVNGRPDFMFRGEPTLLHAFESQGVPLPSECRAGHCGRCRMKLNVGEVRWLLTPQIAIEADEALACCCIPASDLAVEMAETGR
jgi:ferredoxin-NADP reductase